MGRFTPPPPVSAGLVLRAESSPNEERTEDVTLESGAGTWIAPTDSGFRFDAVSQTPETQLSHFHPGDLAAGTVREFTAARAGGQLAAFMEVWISDPPTDLTAGHYTLRLEGSDSADTFDLDLNVADQQHYTAMLDNPTALTDINYSSNNSLYLSAFAQLFVPRNGNVEISAVTYGFPKATASADARRIGIMDLDGDWLGYVELTGVQGPGEVTVRLPRTLELEQDVPYLVAYEGPDGEAFGASTGRGSPLDVDASVEIQNVTVQSEGIASQIGIPVGSYSINGAGVRYDDPAAQSLSDAVRSGENMTMHPSGDETVNGWITQTTSTWEGYYADTFGENRYAGWGSMNGLGRFMLHGSQLDFEIAGDLTLTAVATSTPDAPATPANLNIRLESSA